jgi:hypothetical protein
MKKYLLVLGLVCFCQFVFAQYIISVSVQKPIHCEGGESSYDISGFGMGNFGAIEDKLDRIRRIYYVDKIPSGMSVTAGCSYDVWDVYDWNDSSGQFRFNEDESGRGVPCDPTKECDYSISSIYTSVELLYSVGNTVVCVNDGSESIVFNGRKPSIAGSDKLNGAQVPVKVKITCNNVTKEIQFFRGWNDTVLEVPYSKVKSAFGDEVIYGKELIFQIGYICDDKVHYQNPINGIYFLSPPDFTAYATPVKCFEDELSIVINDLPDLEGSDNTLRLDLKQLSKGALYPGQLPHWNGYYFNDQTTQLFNLSGVTNSFEITSSEITKAGMTIAPGAYEAELFLYDKSESSLCSKIIHFEIAPKPAKIEVSNFKPTIFNGRDGKTYHIKTVGGTGSGTLNITGRTGGYHVISPKGASLSRISEGYYRMDGIRLANHMIIIGHNTCTSKELLFTGNYNEVPPLSYNVNLVTKAPATCKGKNDGRVAINFSGGCGPFTAEIKDGTKTYSLTDAEISKDGITDVVFTGLFTGVQPGDYALKVTDNITGLSIDFPSNLKVDEPNVIVLNPSKVDPICNGNSDGKITLDADGGTGAYVFKVNGEPYDSEKTYSAGTYTCTVTDVFTCPEDSEDVVLNEPAEIKISIPTATNYPATNGSNYQITKRGGTATAKFTIEGRTGGYSLVSPIGESLSYISDSDYEIRNLNAGTYTVKVEHGTCASNSQPIAIKEPEALSISKSNLVDIKCYGEKGSISFTITGGFGLYTVELMSGTTAKQTKSRFNNMSGSFSGINPGIYTIKVTDNESGTHKETISFTINQRTALTYSSNSKQIVCFGEKGSIALKASGGTAPYDYCKGKIIQEDKLSTYTYTDEDLFSGNYSYIIKDKFGCSSGIIPVKIDTQPDEIIISNFVLKTKEAVNGELYHTNKIGGLATAELKITGRADNNYEIVSPTGATLNYNKPDDYFALNKLKAIESQTFQVKQGLCFSNDVVVPTINEPEKLSVSVIENGITDVACHGDHTGSVDFKITGGFGSYTVELLPKTKEDDLKTDHSEMEGSFTGLSKGTYTINVTDIASGSHAELASSFSIKQPAAQLAFDLEKIVQKNPHCFDGADGIIELAAIGGTTPYTFTIADKLGTGRDDLKAGTHICTLIDNMNCPVSPISRTLTHPDNLVLSEVSKINASCAEASNGSATLSLAGGYNEDAKEYTISLSRVRKTENIPVFENKDRNSSDFDIETLESGESRDSRNFIIKNLEPDEYQASVRVNNICNPAIVNFTIGTLPDAEQFQITSVDIKPAACGMVENGELKINVQNGTTYTNGRYHFKLNDLPKDDYLPGAYIPDLNGNLVYKVKLTDKNNCSASKENISIGIDVGRLKMQTSFTQSTCAAADNGEILLTCEDGKAKDHSKTDLYYFSLDGDESSDGSSKIAHSFTGLLAGVYPVSVEDDAGCIVSNIVTVTAQDNPISFDLDSVAESCEEANNGRVIIENINHRDNLSLIYSLSPNFNTLETISETSKQYKGLDGGDDINYTVKLSDLNNCALEKTINVGNLGHSPKATFEVKDSLACNSSSEGRLIFEVSTPGYESNLTRGLYDSKNEQLTSLLGKDLVFENLNNQQYRFILTDTDNCKLQLPDIVVPVKKDAIRIVNNHWTPSSCVRAENGSIEVEALGGKPSDGAYFYGLMPASASVDDEKYVKSTFDATAKFEDLSVGTKFIVVVKDAMQCVAKSSVQEVAVNIDSLQISEANKVDPLCYETSTGEIKPVLINNNEKLSHYYSIAKLNAEGIYEAMPDKYFEEVSLTYKGLGDGIYKISVEDSEKCLAHYDELVLDNPAKAKIVETSFNYIRKKGDEEGEFEFTFSGIDKNFDYILKNVDLGSEIDKGQLSYSAPASDMNKKIGLLAAGNYIFQLTDADACLDFDGKDTYVEPFKIKEPTDALFQTNEKLSNVRCKSLSDGAINISGFGGWGDYSYSMNGTDWQKTGTYINLKAGDYSILIKDSTEVSYLHPFSIGEPDTLNVFIDKVKDATCPLYANGKLSATSINGIPFDKGLNYWLENVDDRSIRLGDLYSDNSYQFKELPKGNYQLFVSDSHSCQASKTFSISEPDTAKIQLTHNYIKAKDDATGEISLKISEGNGVFDYKCFLNEDSEAFETGQTKSTIDLNNLLAGAYRILVRDTAGCVYEADEWMERPIEIREPSKALSFTVEKDTVVSCNGLSDASIKLKAVGGWGDYSYSFAGAEPVKIGEFPLLPAGSYPLQISDSAGIMWSRDVMVIEPEILKAEYLSHKDVNCYGESNGEIALKIEGGNYGYNLTLDNKKWVPGSVLNNLRKGIYNISVKDAKDCSAEVKNIEINQPDEITLFSSLVTKSRCSINNGSISSEFMGGVGSYNYKWIKDTIINGEQVWLDILGSNYSSIDSLYSSFYIVQVKDEHNCELSFNFALGDITDLAIESIDVKDVSCWEYNDGQALANVIKGNKPYIYGWDPNIPKMENDSAWNMLAGTYNLLVRDAKRCAASAEFVVGTPDSLFYQLQNLTQPLCYGGLKGQINLLGTGGTPDYQYSWTNGSTDHTIQELNPGSYTLKLSDSHNCESSFSFDLAYQRQLTPFIGNDTLICDYNSLLANGGDYAQYRWTSNFDVDFSSGKAKLELTEPGNYYLEVEDDDSCLGFDTLQLDVSYLKIEDLKTIDVTCNALANGSAQIEITPNNWEHTVRWPDGSAKLNWDNLSGGTYKVEVEDTYACQDSIEFLIFEPDTLDIDIQELTHPICSDVPNGLIQINAKGGNGDYSYLWADGNTNTKLTDLVEGSYSVSISDKKDCSITKDFDLNYQKSVQNDLGLDFLGKDTLICHYNSLSLDGRDYANHYWTSNADFSSTNRSVELTEPASYYLKIEDKDKCFAYDTLKLDVSYLKIEDLQTTDVTCHALANGNAEIRVTPADWEHTVRWPDGSAKLNWDNLSGGTYKVEVEDSYACQDSIEFLIYEPDTLDLEIEKLTHPICTDVPNGLIQINALGGNGNYSYLWSDGNTNTKLTDLVEGSYSVSITDKKDCAITRNFNLNYQKSVQNDLGFDFLGKDTLICHYNSLSLDGRNYAKHYWTSDAGFSSRNREVELTEPANYYLKIEDEDKCFAYDSLHLDVSYLNIKSLESTDVSCYGFTDGNAQIEVSPEDWQHVISWSDGSGSTQWNNLSAGSYQVQVKDKYNCQDTRAFLINEPDTLNLEIENLFQPLCFGVPNGFIRLKPYGGNGDYSYLWEHGDDNKRLTGLDEGNYKVHVSDKKGCQISHTFNLLYQRTIYPDLGEDLTICKDNYVNLYPGQFNEYKWMASSMVLGTESELPAWQAGEYLVEVKDEDGCTASDQIKLTEKRSDLAPLLLSASSIAMGDTLIVMEVSQPKPESLTWEFTGAHKITEQGDFYCKLVFSEEGMFDIKLSAQLDGCIGQTQQAILVVPAQSIDEDGDENSSEPDTHFSKLSVYPNPSHGPFEAEVKLTEVADVTFYLVNIQSGKIIEKRSRKGLKVYREAYNLTQAGVYCIFAESQGKRKIFKIVVI